MGHDLPPLPLPTKCDPSEKPFLNLTPPNNSIIDTPPSPASKSQSFHDIALYCPSSGEPATALSLGGSQSQMGTCGGGKQDLGLRVGLRRLLRWNACVGRDGYARNAAPRSVSDTQCPNWSPHPHTTYPHLARRVHVRVDAALIQQDGIPPEVCPHDAQREALVDRMHLDEQTGGEEGGKFK